MNFQNHPPVRLFLGDNAMRDNSERFRLGKKAFVVSGKHGADACGAMAEVDEILTALSIPYVRFTEITENPRRRPVIAAVRSQEKQAVISSLQSAAVPPSTEPRRLPPMPQTRIWV